ncbi:MAG: hypothetical protein ACPG8W_03275 [Candidatus Promineifilaceae bacterium]
MIIATALGWVISIWLWLRARQRSEAAVATALFMTLLTTAVMLRIHEVDVLITTAVGYGNVSRFATYVLGTLALYSLMLALKVVFKFSERDTKHLRSISFATVFVLFCTGPMTLVKAGWTPADVPSWAKYGGLIFSATTLFYGLLVCAFCVRQFGRLSIQEPFLHARLRWISIAFAALNGCLYTVGRLYVAFAMFRSSNPHAHPLDTPIRAFLVLAFVGLGVFFLMGPVFKYGTRLWMYWVAKRQLKSLMNLQQALGIRSIIESPTIDNANIDARLCQAVVAIMDAKHQFASNLKIANQERIVVQLMAVDDNRPMPELIAAYSKLSERSE